ncbi:MAG: prolipoprotein diacylglyceryl transferase family protein [Thermomicrobiales bacterium]
MVTDPVAFTIGPLAVRWYGILIMSGVIAGAYLASWLARRKGENPDHLWNMVPIVVFSAIAGAHPGVLILPRLEYVLRQRPDAGVQYPGGWDLDPRGDRLRGALDLAFHALLPPELLPLDRHHRPGDGAGAGDRALGQFYESGGVRRPDGLPWGIYISPEHRPAAYAAFDHFHPTFLYGSIYNLIACLVLTQVCLRIDRDRRLRNGDASGST